jgi:hypothetical protein
MRILRVNSKKGEIEMTKIKRALMTLALAGWVLLMATPGFAKSFNLKDAGISLWIFIIIGAIIILLQLIPAAILFFSFIGTGSAMVFGRKRAVKEEGKEKEELTLPGYGPLKVEK